MSLLSPVNVCALLHKFYVISGHRNPTCNDTIYVYLLMVMSTIQKCNPKTAFVFIGISMHGWLSLSHQKIFMAMDFCLHLKMLTTCLNSYPKGRNCPNLIL